MLPSLAYLFQLRNF